MREVAEDGYEPVVGLRVHRHRLRAHVHHEAVQPLVQEAARLLVRGEVPDGVLEEVGAGVLHAGGLGARDRMTAHEARVGVRLTRSCFVDPTSVTSVSSPEASSAACTSSGSAPTGAQAKHELRALDRVLDGCRGAVDRAALPGQLEPLGVPSEAHHLGVRDVLLRGKADRAADQPDAEDADLHTVENCLPASSAAASSLRR